MPRLLPVLMLPVLCVLGACHGKAADQRSAAGEVLSGSASDAMLPYDALTSAPPRAPQRVAGAAPEDAVSAGDSAASAAPDSAPPAPAPAPAG